jgi:hypothetical protein
MAPNILASNIISKGDASSRTTFLDAGRRTKCKSTHIYAFGRLQGATHEENYEAAEND